MARKQKPKWKLISETDLYEYKCGLKAGDKVRLRRQLSIRDHQGVLTHVHEPGEVWEILPSSREDPVVFLLQPDGKRHTWDDSEKIFDIFELLR